MPHRVIGLWMVLVGTLGVIGVGLFVMLGRDPRRASMCGPRWKRKLLATGLVLLTAVGIVGCDNNAKIASTRTSAVRDAASETLLKDPRWIEYRKAWDRAEDIVFGRIESMPIYSDERTAAVVALIKAGTHLDSLVAGGLITDVEYRYLNCELSILAASLKETPVYAKTVRRMVTFDNTLYRLDTRTSHLKKLADCKVVPETAWELVRKTIVRDLKIIETAPAWDGGAKVIFLDGETVVDGEFVVEEKIEPGVDRFLSKVRKHIEKIDKLSESTDLCIDDSWDAFREGYSYLQMLPQGPGMDLQPDWMGDAFDSVQSNLKALESSKLMPDPMYALLDAELDTLQTVFSGDFVKPDKDTPEGVDEGAMSPAMDRTRARQGALKALVESGALRPRVVDKALAMANADIYTVFDDEMSLSDEMESFLKKHPKIKGVLDSARASVLALRKKIAQCDSGVSDLPRRYHWARLQEIWLRSEYIWEIRVGGYPFNSRGDCHATELVVEARRHVKSLQAAGLLEPTEAGMLDSTLDDLHHAIGYIRGSERYFSLCYDPGGGFSLGQESPEQFRKRLELLEKAQVSGKLHPRVLGTLLYGMERLLASLNFEPSNPMEHEKSSVYEAEAVARIDRLKTVLHKRREQLTSSKDWREFTQTLQYAAKISDVTYVENYQERKIAWIKLSRAQLTLRRLLAAGMLTRDEAFLLGYETHRLLDTVSSGSVSSLQTQYRSDDMPWFKQTEPGYYGGHRSTYPTSNGAAGQWLDILSKAASKGQINPAVLKVVMSNIKLIWERSPRPEYEDSGLFDPEADGRSGDER